MESKIEKIEIAQEREELFREMINEGKLTLKDSRRHFKGNFKYSLEEILFLWLCAMACGFYSYRRIELYATLKIDFLRRFFPYTYGPPTRNTIMRVIALISPEEMNNLLIATLPTTKNEMPATSEIQTIALDGKTHCGTPTTEELKNKLHIVSAFDTAQGITLLQEKVPDKSNEIIAMKSILHTLDLEGKTITIDALGIQSEITALIRKKKGNYILAVKANQKCLLEAIQVFSGK